MRVKSVSYQNEVLKSNQSRTEPWSFINAVDDYYVGSNLYTLR